MSFSPLDTVQTTRLNHFYQTETIDEVTKFRKSLVRLLLPSPDELTSVLLLASNAQTVEVIFHSILYLRHVYPARSSLSVPLLGSLVD